MSDLNTSIARASRWTRKHALPFWQEAGPDRQHGGFVEEFDFSGKDAQRPQKRTRVTCRQVYVFAHAHVLGLLDGRDLIAHGVDYLTSKAWQGRDHGFARLLTRDAKKLDPTPDLYDHAFALFAFAWAYRATGDVTYQDWIHRTADTIEDLFAHPHQAGYLDARPAGEWRLQNPHMHLLEASLAAFQATEEARFRGLGANLIDLFKSHLFDRKAGTLGEYFTETFERAPGAPGRIVEPGHQFEWAWILEQAEQTFAITSRDEIKALTAHSEAAGMNGRTGAVMNKIESDGTPVDGGSRSWPNTERIKAHVARHRLGLTSQTTEIQQSTDLLLDRYLTACEGYDLPSGTWIDAFDADGRPTAERIPASILYHLFLAFVELETLAPASDLPNTSETSRTSKPSKAATAA